MPEIITNYDELVLSSLNSSSLFWIIEYSPTYLGYSSQTNEYNTDYRRYSVLRKECLEYPLEFKNRLNTGKYRIWTNTPREIPWGN